MEVHPAGIAAEQGALGLVEQGVITPAEPGLAVLLAEVIPAVFIVVPPAAAGALAAVEEAAVTHVARDVKVAAVHATDSGQARAAPASSIPVKVLVKIAATTGVVQYALQIHVPIHVPPTVLGPVQVMGV